MAVQNPRVYLGQGIKYPHEVTSFGRIALTNDKDLIDQSLRILLETPEGTEFFREEMGWQGRQLLFEANTPVLRSLLDYFIVDVIQKWERRITVVDVTYISADRQAIDQGVLLYAVIYYRVKQSNEIESYIFPLYKSEIKT